jgi:hypothetical protein
MPTFKTLVADVGCVHVQARNSNHADKIISLKHPNVVRVKIVKVVGVRPDKVRIS